MSGDASDDGRGDESDREETDGSDVRKRIETEADRARSGFDRGLVDALAWLLETETRARIYVYLRQHPESTVEEVAEGTGIYPETVRDALPDLVEDDVVERREDSEEGATEYAACPPSDLVGGFVDRIRSELTSGVDLDEQFGGEDSSVRVDVESGSSAEAEVGDAEADVETDLEGEAELDEEGAAVEGEAGADVDVDTGDGEAEIEGNVDAEVGTDGVEIDVDADVETPDGDGSEGSRESGDGEDAHDADGHDESDDSTRTGGSDESDDPDDA